MSVCEWSPSLMAGNTQSIEWIIQGAITQAPRTRIEFAEQDIIVPEGAYMGFPFSLATQPFQRLLLAEMENPYWRKISATGCVQSGKTFICLVVPLVYHLFELQEDVIVGIPKMEMAYDKWRKEFLPTIQASPKFAKYLPDKGQGSRGGKFDSMKFSNGVWLKFMTGGGGDEMRSGYTARVVVITEVDKMDEASENSRETDPITQIEARTASFGDRGVAYKECTVSIEQGRIWQEYTRGSEGRIVCKCPHCGGWVSPEREHFRGLADAENVIQAGKKGHFACPSCEANLSDENRTEMNAGARLLHKGQSINSSGKVIGTLPETDTLGFRWSAFHNLFWSTEYIGRKEWESQHREDREAGEREARQFIWTIPITTDNGESINVDPDELVHRTIENFPRGYVPSDTRWITVGLDVGKRECHWVAICWRRNMTAHIIDYGKIRVAADELGFREAFIYAIKDFHGRLGSSWTVGNYTRVWVDSRWSTDDVYAGINALHDDRWSPTVGMGAGHFKFRRYTHPDKIIKNRIIWIGERYHMRIGERNRQVYNIDANHWKTRVQESLVLPYSRESEETVKGAITLFSVNDPSEHAQFAAHMASERQVSRFVPGEGTVQVWECTSGNNHWLDSVYLATAAGHRCGFRFDAEQITPQGDSPKPAITSHDGREYMATER